MTGKKICYKAGFFFHKGFFGNGDAGNQRAFVGGIPSLQSGQRPSAGSRSADRQRWQRAEEVRRWLPGPGQERKRPQQLRICIQW